MQFLSQSIKNRTCKGRDWFFPLVFITAVKGIFKKGIWNSAMKWNCKNREFTQPRRRRQQERHKFAYLTVKNNIFARFACAFFIFGHSADVLVLSTTWNDLFCSCEDDVSTRWQMFNFVFLSLKRWFQFNFWIVTTHFATVMTMNNSEMTAETRSYIFRWLSRCRRRRVCVNSLIPRQEINQYHDRYRYRPQPWWSSPSLSSSSLVPRLFSTREGIKALRTRLHHYHTSPMDSAIKLTRNYLQSSVLCLSRLVDVQSDCPLHDKKIFLQILGLNKGKDVWW